MDSAICLYILICNYFSNQINQPRIYNKPHSNKNEDQFPNPQGHKDESTPKERQLVTDTFIAKKEHWGLKYFLHQLIEINQMKHYQCREQVIVEGNRLQKQILFYICFYLMRTEPRASSI